MFKKRIALVVAGLILVIGGAYFLSHRANSVISNNNNVPNYTKPLTFSKDLTPDQRASLGDQFAAIKVVLASSTTDFNAWVALGGVRKAAGDYRGAEEVWLYTANRWPTGSVAFNNLGDLYMNYLKDYPKAEENYKKVVMLDPQNINAYEALYALYRYSYKTDTSAAADILAQGLTANPHNAYLLSLQSQLKAGK